MNRMVRYIGLCLLIVMMSSAIFADDSVFIGDGDITALHLYDAQGNPLKATDELAQNIAQGWIINNPDTPILIVTPLGTVNIFANSLVVIGNLVDKNADLYLVSGQATFTTTNMDGGKLTITTPVSRYTMDGNGEMMVISSDTEESVTNFSGKVTSYNSLTGAKRTIQAFEKLDMQDKMARLKRIEPGYYMTYATYPDAAYSEQVVQEMAATSTAPVPSTPQALVKEMVIEKPDFKGVSIKAIAPTPTSLKISKEYPAGIPATLQTLKVSAVNVAVPEKVSNITSYTTPSIQPQIIVSITPVTPAIPTISSQPKVVAIPSTPTSVQSNTVSAEPVQMAAPAEEATTTSSSPIPPRTTLLYSEDTEKVTGAFGIQFGYQFALDGTDSNAISNMAFVKPYYSKGAFSLRLQGAVSTSDFSTFTNTVYPVPTSLFDKLAYGFSFIDYLRLGYNSSAFYLTLDRKSSISTDLTTLVAPSIFSSDKLVMQNRITSGAVSLTTTIDDLYATNLLDNNVQFASTLLQVLPTSGYRLGFTIGSLAMVDRSPWTLDLYPFISFSFPLIDTRTTQLKVLLQGNGYLPTYPTLDTTAFIDASVNSLFPNYLLAGGISLQKNALFTKLMLTLPQGENRPLLVNEFSYVLDTSYSSLMDILGDFRWQGPNVEAKLLFNVPLTSSGSIADLSSYSHQANYSQFSISYTQEKVKLGLGFSHLGLFDTINQVASGADSWQSLLSGPYSTSYLLAEYAFKPFTLGVKAYYPVNTSTYTVPVLTVTGTISLEKTF